MGVDSPATMEAAEQRDLGGNLARKVRLGKPRSVRSLQRPQVECRMRRQARVRAANLVEQRCLERTDTSSATARTAPTKAGFLGQASAVRQWLAARRGAAAEAPLGKALKVSTRRSSLGVQGLLRLALGAGARLVGSQQAPPRAERRVALEPPASTEATGQAQARARQARPPVRRAQAGGLAQAVPAVESGGLFPARSAQATAPAPGRWERASSREETGRLSKQG
mmetsp:Transcript_11408/g.28848  ORF Transcript_11408/g.28848 Transcript_11408/m.28848 type:complete len:225 (-) Transcript_11408:946-1620(-)